MESLIRDLRFGLRALLKRPGYTVVTVIILALGIGANTAIFSIVNGVLLRSLPFKDPERIVTLWENNVKDGIERDDVSPANFIDWRERSRSFEEMAFANPYSLDYQGKTEPETWQAALVSEGFFGILGINAFIGRTFLPEEYKDGLNFTDDGRDFTVMLTYSLWQRRFGGDMTIIGQKLVLDGRSATVVGVLPPQFKLNLFDQEKVVYAPQRPDDTMRRQRRATYLKVLARLKSGYTVAQARAEMDTIATNLAAEYSQTNAGVGVTTVPLTDQMTGQVKPALLLLFGAVAFVLLIACANVANLMLARGSEREREFAIRAAVGAGHGHLMRQLLTESMLLALIGCAGGLVLASWGIDLIVNLSPGNIPRIEEIGLDSATLIFTLGLTLLTSLIFGIAPALQFSKPDLSNCLKDAGHTATGSSTQHRLRSILVVVEIALALVLMIGAGLLIRSFISLVRTNPGFDTERVVALQTFIWDRYRTPDQRAVYAQDVLERFKATPGVEAAGITTALPFLKSSATTSLPFVIEGRPAPPVGQEPTVFYTVVTNDYFAAMGVPLLRGRLFNQFDTPDGPRVVLINETMARRHFSNEDPVGKKIIVRGTQRGQGSPDLSEIIGVVSDVRHESLEKEPRPEYFRPYSQLSSGSIIFTVRTRVDPALLIPMLKTQIWKVNSMQPLYTITTMDDLISDSLKARRFSLLLLGAFASLALALAVVGIYGVMSLTTRQRTHEIGVRIALGAGAKEIIKMIVGQGMRLALTGIGIGLLVSLALTQLLKGLIPGLRTTDPVTIISIALVLLSVALTACYLPARRATKVDPMIALRYE